ncbi:MAG: hypothetical protein QOI29_985 [Mycobacterium sp.]|jgi:hypothetical protein|nr:hypothetical protein [Mycobacterium sp.]
MTQPGAEAGSPDPKFALAWYPRWLEAWNSHEPDRLKELVTDDFVLQTPTTRMTGMVARGPQGVSDYMRFVVTAYPDLIWEMIAPPMFRLDVRQIAYTWRGSGHFTGVLEPAGIQGTGRAFSFEGLEIFSFRGERACALNAVYDLATLNKQTGVQKAARAAT